MQLMSWMLARLGSRFSLFFEPHRRCVRHSALGRYLDEPLDLMVGLEEPDGTRRVLPFCQEGTLLYHPEQFERLNSITYRGYSRRYRLRFEFNIHSVFYPQSEQLCTMPVFYLEMRLNSAPRVRGAASSEPIPRVITLFLRLTRPGTEITARTEGGAGSIDLAYDVSLAPDVEGGGPVAADGPSRRVSVHERIVSLNTGCRVEEDGRGLSLELPVTEVGSGLKWRLVWAAHCGDPILHHAAADDGTVSPGRFRYVRALPNLDAVVHDAVNYRDAHLARSRRFEKLFDDATLAPAQRHLVNLAFQTFLSNTFWCDLERRDNGTETAETSEWFSAWNGASLLHSTLDAGEQAGLLYVAIWPRLLALQLESWATVAQTHAASGGAFIGRDLGHAFEVGRACGPHDHPVDATASYLLLAQLYAHWVGDVTFARRYGDLLQQCAEYLAWSDTDGSGFPSAGTANAIEDGGPAVRFARKQTYLAVKRTAALQAASDLLRRVGREPAARRYESMAESSATKIDEHAWLEDHYAVCMDPSTVGIVDPATGQPLPLTDVPGWDAYSIHTTNGLLLPALTGQPLLLDMQRLALDTCNAARETRGRYGCWHDSTDTDALQISRNIWRDLTARYLGQPGPGLEQLYWDLQVASNTDDQSHGFMDSYIASCLANDARGVAGLGHLLAGPRLVVDRLAPGGRLMSVEPDLSHPQRWPLLPLADWRAGRIPTCVVSEDGQADIEGQTDPVIIRGQVSGDADMIG